jgi:hypothetical protein
VGTGIPLQIGSVSVIATAAHVLMPFGGVSVLTFGSKRSLLLSGERRGFGHKPGRTVDVDLAVIVLTESERDELRQRFTFSYSLDFASTRPAHEITFYVLTGYPHSRNKASPRLLRETYAVANYFISRTLLPLSKIESPGKFSNVHFALGAQAKHAVGEYGEPVGFPSPNGLSGGGVWRLDFPKRVGAAPVPRLVGVGIEYCRKPGAFVCTRIENIAEMIEDLQR